MVKSLIGRKESYIAAAHSLGLRRIGKEAIHSDSAALQGKLAKIAWMQTLMKRREMAR
ncbi:MAG: 50S ribosomal protein L30 [Oscillospiraceae bacterium]|nr:50S ribosomal protein L30 [Oscillospiraceae bacterium]